MQNKSQLLDEVITKTNNGKDIPIIDKNGVKVHKLTVFEDVILRNLDNLDTVALQVVGDGTKMTYREFFCEVEKYISAYKKLGLKEHDVVSLCLPVGIEFICSYFALTTMGVTCNALNIMFLLKYGVKSYLDERCSHTLICYDEYYKLLKLKGCFDDPKLKNVILTGDSMYNHIKSDSIKMNLSTEDNKKLNVMAFDEFLRSASREDVIKAVDYNENRIATLNYTSGTTGKPKCMGHSDLAPLFLIATHDSIKRDEHRQEKTLLTIPLQHPTGLFYAMVFQMTQGKTLILEPRYDKTLFAQDLIKYEINHAVQAKPFYAQLVQDRADGNLKPGDLLNFRHSYSGGEGVPFSTCKAINDTLHYAGSNSDLLLGYGRSEEGSSTIVPYNIEGRNNTVGVPLTGIKAKIVDAETLEDLPQVAGVKGEILVNTPVTPINHCYLNPYNKNGQSDDSIVDKDGVRWARAKDIATLVEMPDGTLSFLVLGRAQDYAKKNDKKYYLFDFKELVSDIEGIQECEAISLPGKKSDYVTIHVVLEDKYKDKQKEIVKAIYNKLRRIDGVRFYDRFGINATSGKCDRAAMRLEETGYYSINKGEIVETEFIRENEENIVRKRIK